MPLVDSEASSLVNTNELLEFIDTMDINESQNVKQSEITVKSEQTSTSENPIEQTSVDPKSESQFSSFMSYHEGESSSMDPSTVEQELSKFLLRKVLRRLIQELMIKWILIHIMRT